MKVARSSSILGKSLAAAVCASFGIASTISPSPDASEHHEQLSTSQHDTTTPHKPTSLSLTFRHRGAVLCEGSKQEKPSAVSTLRKRWFGLYENRLRRFSTPEKVFEYFASVTRGNERFMTFQDLVRAVTPFAPGLAFQQVGSENFKYSLKSEHVLSDEEMSTYKQLCAKVIAHHADSEIPLGDVVRAQRQARQSLNVSTEVHNKVIQQLNFTPLKFDLLVREKQGQGSPHVMQMIDEDGDGLVSFQEFVLVSTLLAIPTKMFAIAFQMIDVSGDGLVDQGEFEAMMDNIVKRTAAGEATPARPVHDGIGSNSSSDEWSENTGVWKVFFGSDGKQGLSFQKFKQFRDSLQRAIESTEFDMYDSSCTGDLTSWEFAAYLAARCRDRQQNELLGRVEHLHPANQNQTPAETKQQQLRVSFEQFVTFNRFLEYLPEFEVAVSLITGNDSSRGLTRSEFAACSLAALDGVALGDAVVDVIFQMFDRDLDGMVSQDEILSVLDTRRSVQLMQAQDTGVAKFFMRLGGCLGQGLGIQPPQLGSAR